MATNTHIPMQGLSNKERLDALMMGFASGSLSPAESLIVASHIALKPELKADLCFYEEVGGALLDGIEPCVMSQNCLDSVLASIDEIIDTNISDEKPADNLQTACDIAKGQLPASIARYVDCESIDGLKWKKLFKGVETIDLNIDDDGAIVRLLRLEPGYVAPEHKHEEFELTLILDGAYTDQFGAYEVGDLSIIDEDAVSHSPRACPEQGCICLVATFAPLKFKNPLHRLINTFVKF